MALEIGSAGGVRNPRFNRNGVWNMSSKRTVVIVNWNDNNEQIIPSPTKERAIALGKALADVGIFCSVIEMDTVLKCNGSSRWDFWSTEELADEKPEYSPPLMQHQINKD